MLHDDKELRQTFDKLFTEYQRKVYYLLRNLTRNHDEANDLAQEVWVKVWRFLPKFEHKSSYYTWIYRIAINEFISLKRKDKRMQKTEFTEAFHDVRTGSDGPDYVAIRTIFDSALELLPEKQRVVFHLRYFDEVPFAQMAEMLHTSEGALKASYHHAVKKIEKHINKG